MRGHFGLLLLVLALGTLAASGLAQAQDEPTLPGVGPLSRLLRGTRDILVSPFEVPATIRRVASEKDPFFGLWAGGLEGIGNGLMRLCAGVVEVGTFYIPSDYLPLYNKRLGERATPPLRPPRGITKIE